MSAKHQGPKRTASQEAFYAALRRLHGRGQTRISANCLAEEMWPNARHCNAHGQSFNLAAGAAGVMLRYNKACHEVENRVWEIIPEFIGVPVEGRKEKSASLPTRSVVPIL